MAGCWAETRVDQRAGWRAVKKADCWAETKVGQRAG